MYTVKYAKTFNNIYQSDAEFIKSLSTAGKLPR